MRVISAAVSLLTASTLAAQSIAPAVPVRPLGKVVATSPVGFSYPASLRALSDGRVLVNDPSRRQVLLLDSVLANPIVVIDSAAGVANSYGARNGGMAAFLADSTFFIDAATPNFLIIDPQGKIARQMALPTAANVTGYLTQYATLGYPARDGKPRLVFRMPAPRGAAALPAPGEKPVIPPPPDSALVVTFNPDTRAIDTVAAFKIMVQGLPMLGTTSSAVAPMLPRLLPTTDDWAVASDGSIAILRGQDYHIDWLNRDGTRTSTAKVAYDWRRLSDDDKIRIADSLTADRDSSAARQIAALPAGSVPLFDAYGAFAGYYPPSSAGRGAAPAPVTPTRPSTRYTAASIPEYMPPFKSGALHADLDGRLWVQTLPTTPVSGGPVFDFVNRSGTLIDRVQIPAGRTLFAFGPGGAVYMTSRDAGVARLEKAYFK
jgi:hypothetical protein